MAHDRFRRTVTAFPAIMRNAKSPDVPGAVYIEGDLALVMVRAGGPSSNRPQPIGDYWIIRLRG